MNKECDRVSDQETDMENEIDRLISFAVKEGYIDDSAESWTAKEKEDYYAKCQMAS